MSTGLDDAYTKALLHFNGANASTVFTDEAGNVWQSDLTYVCQLSTAKSKFGSASLFSPQFGPPLYTGGRLYTTATSSLQPGNQDYTLDYWIYYDQSGLSGLGRTYWLYQDASNYLRFDNYVSSEAGNNYFAHWMRGNTGGTIYYLLGKAITKFEDNGSGNARATSAGHGLANSNVIHVEGGGYGGAFYTVSNVTLNTFDIDWGFSGDSTGTWFHTIPEPSNGWHHVALIRYGSVISSYFDGVMLATGTAADCPAMTGTVSIGGTGGWAFSGYIDEYRFSKGIARWTSNFTPPVEEYYPRGLFSFMG